MRTLTIYAATLCLILSPLASAQSSNDAPQVGSKVVSLRPDWTTGQQARYQFWTRRDRTVAVRFGGKSRKVASKMVTNGQMSWHVDQVSDDGSSTCTMVIDWMTIKVSANGKTQTNDSRKAEGDTPPLHHLITALTATPITCAVAADGTITSIDGLAKIKAKIPKKLQAIAPDKRELIESASELATLPGAPAQIAPGRTYDQSFHWNHQLGTMNQDWQFTLASVKLMAGIPVATVKGKAQLDLNVDRSKMPKNAPPINVNLREGSAKAEILFDLTRHEAVGRNQTQKQSLQINISLPKGHGQLKRRIDQSVQSQILRLSEK